jgi:Zn-dependent protease
MTIEFLEIFQIIIVMLFAVILHECSHGWVALQCGDPTAKMAGRLTLNPFKHIDPLGTIIVPMVLRLLGITPIGWAKPVPVNFGLLRNPKRDMIWVALAGPVMNLFLAVMCSILLKFSMGSEFLVRLFSLGIIINLLLAVFNLTPVPPLDGSRIVMGVLPDRWARKYRQIEPFGIIILLILINTGILNYVWSVIFFMAMLLGVNVAVLM